MPLVTWGAFVPDVFSPAEILDIIIPRQTFDPSHNLSVVLKIIVGRMVENQIISGALKENEMLPSIRGLAKDLKISFVTTKRAYDELEREGFIYTIQAKGCYVAPKNVELLREENLKRIEGHIEEIVRLSAACNLAKSDIKEMLDFAFEAEKDEN